MPKCITITSLEHLPLEETLLINYTIICDGVWDLFEDGTGYRNLCDSEWTLMLPNIQHPRHTDLPIIVNGTPVNATFAWNYGGIQGISAVDFNSSNSYFVQLAFYNDDCTSTGGPGGSNGNVIVGATEPEPSNEPTTPTGGPSGPGGGMPGGPGVPNPQDPQPGRPVLPGGAGGQGAGGQPGGGQDPNEPNTPTTGPTTGGPGSPGTAEPGEPTADPGGGIVLPDPGNPEPGEPGAEPGEPGDPGTPEPGEPTSEPIGGVILPGYPEPGTQPGEPGGGGVVLPGQPGTAEPIEPGEEPTVGPGIIYDPPLPYVSLGNTNSIEPPQINPGGSEPGSITSSSSNTNPLNQWVRNVIITDPRITTTIITTTTSPSLVISPNSSLEPSGPISSSINTILTPGTRNAVIPTVGPGNTTLSNQFNLDRRKPDLGVNEADSYAAYEGNLERNSLTNLKLIPSQNLWKTIEVTRPNPGDYSALMLPRKEISFGDSIKIDGIYRPSNRIVLKFKLIVIDESDAYEVYASQYTTLFNTRSFILGLSINSSLFKVGKLSILLVAIDKENNVVSAISKDVVLTSTNYNNALTAGSRIRNLTKGSVNLANISTNPLGETPVRVNLKKNRLLNLLVKDSSDITENQKLSILVQNITKSNSKHQLSLIAVDDSLSAYDSEFVLGTANQAAKIKGSKDRIQIKGYQVFEGMHSAALIDADIVPANYTNPDSILVSVSSQDNEKGEADVYISNNFSLKPASATVSSGIVTAIVPYAFQKVALIINGKQEGNVPANYTVYHGTTNKQGSVTFSDATVSLDDYYSILLVDDEGNTNPYKDVLYSNRYV